VAGVEAAERLDCGDDSRPPLLRHIHAAWRTTTLRPFIGVMVTVIFRCGAP
jgi:hypothetical protein